MESETPLHHAESAEEVSRLVAQGFAVNAPGWMGATPLHEAAGRGNAGVVEALLQYGADPNARRPENFETPLHFAQNGEVVSLLLACGAELEGRTRRGGTPLQWAARFGLVSAMQALIAAGADVNLRDEDGETALWHAAWTGQAEATALLLSSGADVNAVTNYGETALHKAARHGKIEVVKALLGAGADPTMRDQSGAMPINVCAGATKQFLEETMGPAALADRVFLEAPSRRKLGLTKVRVHPERAEAVTVAEQAILTRWALEDPPRVLVGLQAAYEGFQEIRFCPGTELFVALSPERVELRRWDNLEVVTRIDRLGKGAYFTAADVSPDGRRIAVADTMETLALFESGPGRLLFQTTIHGAAGCLRFSPSGQLLAAACAEQGGGFVKVYGVRESLSETADISRNPGEFAADKFVDAVVHVEFSPDGSALALFETSDVYNEAKPKGWRGNVVLYETNSWEERWCVSVDASLTGDKRSLEQMGLESGFFGEIAFASDDTLACGATRGQVLLFRVSDSVLLKRVQVDAKAPVLSLAGVPGQGALWAALGKPAGKLVPIRL